MAEISNPPPFYQDVEGFRIPGFFLTDAFKSARKYKPVAGDFFVATFPKSGTTWTQQILFLIFTKGKRTENPLEFWSRSPFLEMTGAETAEQMVRPGAIKTHLSFQLVPYSKEAKYIYVVRNPKDTLVSFYHHTRTNLYLYTNGKFDDYFELFLNGETDFGDYFEHVLSWYEHRNDPNVLFMTYEEMKKDAKTAILKIGKFLGEEYEHILEDDQVLNKVLEYSSFEYMKTVFNDSMEEMAERLKSLGVDMSSVPMSLGMKHIMEMAAKYKTKDDPKFEIVREGVVGGWRKAFSEDQNKRMNEKISLKLKDTELYSFWSTNGYI